MKFTQPVCEAILKDIGDEVPYQIACESHGVHYNTFTNWVRLGTKELEEGKNQGYYAQFLVALRNVQKKSIRYHVSRASDSEKGHRGSEWILERRHWKYFSPKVAEIEFNERLDKLERKRAEEDGSEENKE